MASPLHRLARTVREISHAQRRLFEIRTGHLARSAGPAPMSLAELEALWQL